MRFNTVKEKADCSTILVLILAKIGIVDVVEELVGFYGLGLGSSPGVYICTEHSIAEIQRKQRLILKRADTQVQYSIRILIYLRLLM